MIPIPVLFSVLALFGCAGTNGIVAGAAGPRAQPCGVSLSDPAAIRDVYQDSRTATLQVGNDGGWCGWYERLTYQTQGPGAWQGSQIVQAPAHGTLRVRQGPGGDRVHVEYSAAPGYRGPDAFAVRLGPGYSLRSAAVTVVPATPGPGLGPRLGLGLGAGAGAPEVGVTSTLATPSSVFHGGSNWPGR